jgi:signal transduction histidine kinase/integral membrane sensor domain MASE1
MPQHPDRRYPIVLFLQKRRFEPDNCSPTMTKPSTSTNLVHATLYFILGALGLSLAISPGYSSPIFPAAGLALALSIRFGRHGVMAVFIGSFALNYSQSLLNARGFADAAVISALIASGSALQCTIGAALVRRFLKPGWEYLDNEKSIFHLLLVGGVVACLCSATVGVGSMYLLSIIDFDEVFFSWWTWYAGDALGVFLATPLFLLLFQTEDQRDWLRFRSVVFPLGFAVLLAGAVFYAASRWESTALNNRVAEEGENIQRLLESRVTAHQEMLSSLNRLIEVNPEINREQFDQFTKLTLAEQNDVSALSFNPLVFQQNRTEFESLMAAVLDDPAFVIRERNTLGDLVPASDAPLHVPVIYISPQPENQQAVGYDIYSDPSRKQAIDRSLENLNGTVTAPVQLIQDNQNRTGVLLMQPIFNREGQNNPDQRVQGFAVAVIKVDDMIRIALREKLNDSMALRLKDADAAKDQSLFYQTSNWARSKLTNQYAWRNTIAVADRTWQLEMIPTVSYLKEHRPVFAWVVGALSMFFAALLQVMLMAVSGRTELVKRKVREQTRFIQEQKQKLEITSAQANAANLAKSRFLATMSHELRTPMNGILGVAKLIQLESDNTKQKEQAEIILTSGEMLLTLLNDILDIAKIEAGKIELHAHPFAPQDILTDVKRLYEAQAHHKKIALQVDWHGPVNVVYLGDAGRIRQILINLVSNALKFTQSGHVKVIADALPGAIPRQVELRFEVQDSGIGITQDKLAQLFQPFSQLDDSNKRKHAGSGLGLSIVKSMTELMGGNVGVESVPGQGSRFWFTVRVGHTKSLGKPDNTTTQIPLSKVQKNLQQFTGDVLVVEDDLVNQTVIRAFLGKLGLKSENAANGALAVQRITSGHRPKLILMDLQMPELDGYDATREIRAFELQQGLNPIPIIALTAAAFPEERARCFEAGMNGFLSKPVSLNELMEEIGKHLLAQN